MTTGNDGVFLSPAVGEMLHVMAVLRAVEHQRYLVRSMKTGVSSVLDPTGRAIALAPSGARKAIGATVVPNPRLTFYDRFGAWLVWLCGILAALLTRRSAIRHTFRSDT